MNVLLCLETRVMWQDRTEVISVEDWRICIWDIDIKLGTTKVSSLSGYCHCDFVLSKHPLAYPLFFLLSNVCCS